MTSANLQAEWAAEDANRGAALLDKIAPDWPIDVIRRYGWDLGTFEVQNMDRCVLTAVFGSFVAGLAAIRMSGIRVNLSTVNHGFWGDEPHITRAWRDEVIARLPDEMRVSHQLARVA